MTESVVRTKAVRCSTTHFSQQVEPPRSVDFDHEENMTSLNLDASMDGVFNTDFTDSLFKLNDDQRLVSRDDMMSTVGDRDSISKEILDYFTSEIGGEWLSSL
ncbi:hypothetical protein L1987_01209 [Smallanthus sonchifolius]|uniref:Uncharacterized protein n=1 Tax=Smallanthus sonchifolius TaxID=185202 RepID=A0ACB9K4F4_9ASTR|nr:hypothetical protein L1987_87731 [Smallanthus sonchifolius]KAI3827139.1 hypothetical protein L1987_01209 [Smallanthus sonchifolius]